MARYNYNNIGDDFSEWHRKHDGISYVDVDWVEICKKCRKILLVGELCKCSGLVTKSYYITQSIARALGVPGYLVFYETRDKKIMTFRYKMINPIVSRSFLKKNSEEFLTFIKDVHKLHNRTCVKSNERKIL